MNFVVKKVVQRFVCIIQHSRGDSFQKRELQMKPTMFDLRNQKCKRQYLNYKFVVQKAMKIEDVNATSSGDVLVWESFDTLHR